MNKFFRCLSLGDAALIAVAAMAVIAIVATSCTARAHDAPTGWSYPFACCSSFDCRMVPYSQVREGGDGYVIVTTGEVIPYSGDTRLKESPDGEFHWCSVGGADDSRTICLFVPPRSY